VVFLSGPEGGLSPAEEALALSHGFAPVTLGNRTLRAETAPLAALAVVQAWCDE
jgi:16S rRNA (uracil1498-N3)-methyltransferase